MPTPVANDKFSAVGRLVPVKYDHLEEKREYIFRSKLPDIDIPTHLSLPQYVLQKASQFSEKSSIIDSKTGTKFSYAEVEATSRRVAAGLVKLGIQKGDVVMLLLPNCPQFVPLFLGVAVRGAIATTANPLYTQQEIGKQARASQTKLVITQSAHVDKLSDIAAKGVTVLTTDQAPEGYQHVSVLTEANENDWPEEDMDPDDIVALPYSSGTTGLPKGVMLSHKNLVISIAQQMEGENPNLYIAPEDVVLCVLPLYHMYSLYMFLCSLRVGATLVIMEKYEIGKLLEVCQNHRVTITPFVPPIVLAIAKNPIVSNYDMSSIRMVMSAAAPLGKELEYSLKARLPNAIVAQLYGMTEAGPLLAMSLAYAKNPFPVKPGSCGTIVRNAEAKIVSPETGVSLPHNQLGEICIRGSQIMKGYLNDPESTALMVDKYGWLHTGDVGYIDEDEEVFIVDRIKEIIRFKGFQVPPAELEAILVSHPSIADAAVVPQKDDVAGEVPIAFVVRLSEVSEDEIKEFVAKQVVFYKRLHQVFFTEAIPKSPSGKILRKDLRITLSLK
ncbi:hypothetical protein O6H91_01G043000 [Diphasiastrum complanatum]|uniref:Uncharacterized protein n=1 Tax=Diphasiastrum complanatum TaxID=34168 RepID=A0ACC2EQG5_DIPCM|nr:hypothetical protein O6H91_01G043000 [Diphasiastrum complanatum]